MAEKYRCKWAENPEFHKYHDEEWGKPVHDDKVHFEFLILEGAQAGLSWLTVLRKREGYRKNFAGFDWSKVSKFTDKDVERILKDPGIIRNKLKVKSAVQNAKAFMKIREEFGSFDKYIWGFTNNKAVNHSIKSIKDIPAKNEISDRLSADMKKRGFNFVGSTIMYAHLQAVGIINDHENLCFRKKTFNSQK